MAGNNVEIEWVKGLGVPQDFGATLSTVPENQPGHFDEIERTHLSSSTLKVCTLIFVLLPPLVHTFTCAEEHQDGTIQKRFTEISYLFRGGNSSSGHRHSSLKGKTRFIIFAAL